MGTASRMASGQPLSPYDPDALEIQTPLSLSESGPSCFLWSTDFHIKQKTGWGEGRAGAARGRWSGLPSVSLLLPAFSFGDLPFVIAQEMDKASSNQQYQNGILQFTAGWSFELSIWDITHLVRCSLYLQ